MGRLDDYSLDQVAGALALVISSLGGLLLIIFKSRCTRINLCCGLWSCMREVPQDNDEDEEKIIPPQNKIILPNINASITDRRGTPTPRPETDTEGAG